MPARPEGVYADGKGGWYLKATLGRDPLTGKRSQVTRRGFRTAAEAGRARQELLSGDRRTPRPSAVGMTLDQLLDLYLDGLDADERLSVKTRFDYRKNAEAYVRPLLGDRRVRDITPGDTPRVAVPPGEGRRRQDGQAARAQHDPAGPGSAG
jgi:Arm DNA-binding domain